MKTETFLLPALVGVRCLAGIANNVARAAEQPERVKEMQTRLQALTANPANAEFLKHKETNP